MHELLRRVAHYVALHVLFKSDFNFPNISPIFLWHVLDQSHEQLQVAHFTKYLIWYTVPNLTKQKILDSKTCIDWSNVFEIADFVHFLFTSIRLTILHLVCSIHGGYFSCSNESFLAHSGSFQSLTLLDTENAKIHGRFFEFCLSHVRLKIRQRSVFNENGTSVFSLKSDAKKSMNSLFLSSTYLVSKNLYFSNERKRSFNKLFMFLAFSILQCTTCPNQQPLPVFHAHDQRIRTRSLKFECTWNSFFARWKFRRIREAVARQHFVVR